MEKKVQEDGSQVRDERIERGSADSVCVCMCTLGDRWCKWGDRLREGRWVGATGAPN